MDDDAALYDDITTMRRLTYYMNEMKNTYKGFQDIKRILNIVLFEMLVIRLHYKSNSIFNTIRLPL